MMKVESPGERRLLNAKLFFFNHRTREDVFISRRSLVLCRLSVDTGTHINRSFLAKGSGRVSIGKYCAIGWNVKCLSTNHDINYANLQYSLQREIGAGTPVAPKRDVHIGNNVWIGDSAILLPGVTVGDGAVIGSGSVVTRDVAPYCIHAGNPARFVKKRFSEEKIEMLLKIKWWEWPLEKIRIHREFFQTNLNESDDSLLRKLLENSL